MKRNILMRFWVVIGILALAGSASGALSVEEQVKILAARYSQVEDQLARSIRYTSKDESRGATTVRQEWYNGAGELIKVAVERNDASGRELTEYIPHDLDSDFGWRGLFMLTRKETPAPDSGTQVEESRKYFGETEEGLDHLIRELRKSAHFKPGESTDTLHVPNVMVDLSKQGKGDSGGAEGFLGGESHELASALRKAGPPQFFDPFANVQGDSDKYRVIHGSVSPDGRFAIAMGLPPEQSNWDALYEDENYFYENGARDYDVPNYIIDLAEKKILGKTGCHYFGTKRRYNHQQCILRWSPDSLKFVQLWDDKWSSTECVAGKISPGPKLAGAVDLDKAIGKKTYAFVKKRFDSENGGAGELSLQINKVSNDGTIDLEASEQCRFGDCRGETIFKVNERLRLSDGSKGPRLEILNMRRLPNEQ
jgi:hypothetical protein